jgi:hypothetical protein
MPVSALVDVEGETGRGRQRSGSFGTDVERVSMAFGAVAEDLSRDRQVEGDDVRQGQRGHAVHGSILTMSREPAVR